MTIGQRIAQKRKELGLSQEALGERLGVSRQTVYKWEADAALPEIEKLIALAKLFAVPVGWLLGTEEHGAAADESRRGEEENTELNETQLAMVKEIVAQYLAAQPKPKRRRWLQTALALLAAAVVWSFFSQLEDMRWNYNELRFAVNSVEASVNGQISGITNRVEAILKAQNDLAADYGSNIAGANLGENTISFSVYALPKTRPEGLRVEFSLANGKDEPVFVPGTEGADGKFTAELTGKLTDYMELTAIFIQPDGTREMQPLDRYERLYSASFPDLHIMDYELTMAEVVNNTLSLDQFYVSVDEHSADQQFPGNDLPTVADYRLGLFRNNVLLAWAVPCEKPATFHGFDDQQFFYFDDLTLENLTADDRITVAAVVTDSYGRQYMSFDIPYRVNYETDFDAPYLTYVSSVADESHDVADWHFN